MRRLVAAIRRWWRRRDQEAADRIAAARSERSRSTELGGRINPPSNPGDVEPGGMGG